MNPSARRPAIVLTVLGVLLASCGGSGETPTASEPAATEGPADSGAPSASAELSATPDLTGETIRISISAPPQGIDGPIAVMGAVLEEWGAEVDLINQLGQPAAIRVVLSDHADVSNTAATAAMNSGLVVFGALQPRTDWYLVGAPGIESLDDLRAEGRVYGGANPGGQVELMWELVQATFDIGDDEVAVRDAGSASARVVAMLEGQIHATFAHIDQWQVLTEQGFTTLLVMAEEFPDLAEAYMGSSIFWLRENPDLAVAINLAYLEASRIFREDPERWIAITTEYSGEDEAAIRELYDVVSAGDLWPITRDAFSLDGCRFSQEAGLLAGIIEDPPPTEDWCIQEYWDEAADLAGLP